MKEPDERQKKIDDLGQMQNTVLDLLNKVVKEYNDYSESKTIKMALSNTLKEINSIRLKVVVGDGPEIKENNHGERD